MIPFIVTAVVAVAGYWQSRKFVTSRLRFVDAIHSPWAAAVAGVAAAVIAWPVVAFLPIVTTATAVVFGGSVAVGVVSGARDIRRRLGA
jgi:hypothetical protein